MKFFGNHTKIVLLLLCVFFTQLAVASFIGHSTSKKSKYSLKNLQLRSVKTFPSGTLNSFKNFSFKGIHEVPVAPKMLQTGTSISYMRFENGNTSFVFPYKYQIKVSKFNTPKPAQQF